MSLYGQNVIGICLDPAVYSSPAIVKLLIKQVFTYYAYLRTPLVIDFDSIQVIDPSSFDYGQKGGSYVFVIIVFVVIILANLIASLNHCIIKNEKIKNVLGVFDSIENYNKIKIEKYKGDDTFNLNFIHGLRAISCIIIVFINDFD